MKRTRFRREDKHAEKATHGWLEESPDSRWMLGCVALLVKYKCSTAGGAQEDFGNDENTRNRVGLDNLIRLGGLVQSPACYI